MRVIPETTVVEGADATVAAAGNSPRGEQRLPMQLGPSGAICSHRVSRGDHGTGETKEAIRHAANRGGRSDARENRSGTASFWHEIQRIWLKALMRRSQKVCKKRLYSLIDHEFALPRPHITHPEGWLALNPVQPT